MQKLHFVGFTPDLDGLILTDREGSTSGSHVVALDDRLLQVMSDAGRVRSAANAVQPGNDARRAASRQGSALSPRELQDRLRAGWTVEEVAKEAGTDVAWVNRFAAPVRAEQAQVVNRARELVFDKARLGPSILPLGASVQRNLLERGLRLPDDELETLWSAFQLSDGLWVVRFAYTSRGRRQQAEWIVDLATGRLQARDRLASQLGHVAQGRAMPVVPDDAAAVAPAAPPESSGRRRRRAAATASSLAGEAPADSGVSAPKKKRSDRKAGETNEAPVATKAAAAKAAGTKRASATTNPAAAAKAAGAKKASAITKAAAAKAARANKASATTKAAGAKAAGANKASAVTKAAAGKAPGANKASAVTKAAKTERATATRTPARNATRTESVASAAKTPPAKWPPSAAKAPATNKVAGAGSLSRSRRTVANEVPPPTSPAKRMAPTPQTAPGTKASTGSGAAPAKPASSHDKAPAAEKAPPAPSASADTRELFGAGAPPAQPSSSAAEPSVSAPAAVPPPDTQPAPEPPDRVFALPAPAHVGVVDDADDPDGEVYRGIGASDTSSSSMWAPRGEDRIFRRAEGSSSQPAAKPRRQAPPDGDDEGANGQVLHGPLRAPAPVAVPDHLKEAVSGPIGDPPAPRSGSRRSPGAARRPERATASGPGGPEDLGGGDSASSPAVVFRSDLTRAADAPPPAPPLDTDGPATAVEGLAALYPPPGDEADLEPKRRRRRLRRG